MAKTTSSMEDRSKLSNSFQKSSFEHEPLGYHPAEDWQRPETDPSAHRALSNLLYLKDGRKVD